MKVGPRPSKILTVAGYSVQLVLNSRLPKKNGRCRSGGAFEATKVKAFSPVITRVVSPPRSAVTGVAISSARTGLGWSAAWRRLVAGKGAEHRQGSRDS